MVFRLMVFCPIIGVIEFDRPPVYAKLFLAFSARSQWNRMSMAFVRFGVILPLTTPSAVELSVCNGVGGCGRPISSRMILM